MSCSVDHLVIAAHSLAQGAAWCEQTLGLRPGPGGRHALMGTRNQLFSIASSVFPLSYAEIIAIDPEAPPPARRRWFGLDRADLQAALKQGPRLLHWAARTQRLDEERAAMLRQGLDPGPAVALARAGAAGELRWRLTIRDDGELLARGAVPSLIEWQGAHPAASLPASGASLQALRWCGGDVVGAASGPAVDGVERMPESGPPVFEIRLQTPRGLVSLRSSSSFS